MLSRSLAGGVAVLAAVLVVATPAHGQKRSQGTPMSTPHSPASASFGCETRWGHEFGSGNYVREPTGHSTCTAWSFGNQPDLLDTHMVPGPGFVSRIRVRSGPRPAPLKVTIIKRLFQTHPVTGQITDTQCCTGTGSESVTFNPTPNGVSEIALNPPLKVTTTPSRNGASGHNDIVALSAMGPGDLPTASVGPHTLFANYNAPTMFTYYPKVATGLQGQAEHGYVNYRLLMQYDWEFDACAGASGAKARASQCKQPPQTPKNPQGRAMAAISGKTLKMRKGKVSVKVKCATGTKARCKGKVRLYTRPKRGKAKLLAGKSLNLADGKTKRYSLKLGRKARKRVKKKSNKVQVRVGLGKTLGTVKKNMTLKR